MSPFQGQRAPQPSPRAPQTFFATCPWPSLCEQSELQCWRRNRRLCEPVQISVARALPLTFDISILNTLPFRGAVASLPTSVFDFKRPPLTPSPPFLALSLSANLGADTSESGSRHDRIWEQTRSPLGAETPTSIGNEKAGCCELCPPITSRATLWPAMQGSALFIMGKPRSLG